jgi:hypothetical protein
LWAELCVEVDTPGGVKNGHVGLPHPPGTAPNKMMVQAAAKSTILDTSNKRDMSNRNSMTGHGKKRPQQD